MTKLDQLLARITPERMLDPQLAKLDAAINAVTFTADDIQDHKTLYQYLGHFIWTVILGPAHPAIRSPREDGLDMAGQANTVESLYGRGWESLLLEIIQTGIEGGLHRVLRRIGTAVADQFADNAAAREVQRFWASLSTAEQVEIPTEYFRKFRHLLTSVISSPNDRRMVGGITTILSQHPRNLRALGRLDGNAPDRQRSAPSF